MTKDSAFTVLRFIGERFKGGVLPVDVAKNLSAYQDVLIEIAKEIWRENNPNRSRLPQNFAQQFQLSLEKITEGSALAHLPRISDAEPTLVPEDFDFDIFWLAQEEFQRFVNVANRNGAPPEISEKIRSKVRHLRENLAEHEILEVRPAKRAGQPSRTFRISQKTKGRLLEKPEPKLKTVNGFGLVQLIDDGSKSIRIVSDIGKFNYVLNWRNLREEFGASIGGLVEFNVKAMITETGSIVSVEEQYSVSLVEPNAEATRLYERLDELGNLSSGWFNGEGNACDESSLIVARDLGAYLSSFYRGIAAFPLQSGGVQLEFSHASFEVTIEVTDSKIRLEVLDDDTDEYKEMPFPVISPRILSYLSDLKEIFEE